jgi:acetyl esterase/lipase
MGYHTFVLRYSVYFEGKKEFPPLNAELPVNPHSVHPAPVRDVGAAMLAIRAHAAEWHVDPERVAVCGFSAGAHNAGMYSVSWHRPLLVEHFGVDASQLRPAAAILCYMLSDYPLMKSVSIEGLSRMLFRASCRALLGEYEPDDETLAAVSPALQVTEHTPPTFLWSTAADDAVPVENTTRMASARAHRGIPFEAHIFEGGQHGLSLANQATAPSRDMMDADAEQWTGLAERWLRKRFAPEMPDRMEWNPQP